VADELRRCRAADRALREYIETTLQTQGLPAAATCPWPSGAAALDLPRRGAFVAYGGTSAITDMLADAFIRNGGELRCGIATSDIVVEQGRAVGVVAAGQTYRAPQIVLAVPHGPPTCAMYLALPAAALAPTGALHRILLDNGTTVSVAIAPSDDPTHAPDGEQVLTAIGPVALGRRWESLLLTAIRRIAPIQDAAILLRHSTPPGCLSRLLQSIAFPDTLGLQQIPDAAPLGTGIAAAVAAGSTVATTIEREIAWRSRRSELAARRIKN
jgi:hypothetical protein